MTSVVTAGIQHDAFNRPLKVGDTVGVIRGGADLVAMEILGFSGRYARVIRCDAVIKPGDTNLSPLTGFSLWGAEVNRSWFKLVLLRTVDGREIPVFSPTVDF